MKAVDFLRMQRDHIEELFGELQVADETSKAALAAQIASLLNTYETAAEEIFYLVARRTLDSRTLGNQPVHRATIEQPGFIEGCIARTPQRPSRLVRSFDTRGEPRVTRASRIALPIAEDERDLFRMPLALIQARLEVRFNALPFTGRPRLVQDESRQVPQTVFALDEAA